MFNKRITINRNVRFGKPTIRGTRIAVADILDLIGAGFGIDEIPGQYPGITKDDVLAALQFASHLTEEPSRIFTKEFALN